MNKSISFGLAWLVTPVLVVTGWWMLPSLQDSKRTVGTETSTEIERARRLLHQYDAELNYRSLLSDQLASYVDEVDPDDLSEDVEDEYQRLHETFWASYQPMDWDRGSPARANYGNLPRQIRDGLKGLADASTKNEHLLDQALAAADRALAVSSGDASARVDPEANRLKAVALYHKGLTRWMEAQMLRREADQYRRELVILASDTSSAVASAGLVGGDVADDIDVLRSETDDLEAGIDEHTDDIEEAEDLIADLEGRLADAVSRRDEARHAIERLKAQGTDPSDPNAANHFADELATLATAYRDAEREAQALEHGTYTGAELDDRGDYLTSRYVDADTRGKPEIRLGLDHYRNERRILTATVANEEQRLKEVRASIADLEAVKESTAGEAGRLDTQVRKTRESASEAFADLDRAASEAFTIEDEALRLLDKSAGSAKSAAGYAKQWVSDARRRVQNLSPEAKDRSAFVERTKAGWIGAFIAAQEADARLAKAWIHYGRYRAATQNAATLAKVSDVLQLNEADAQAEKDKAQYAHDVGVAEITQAMTVLKRAHQGTGKQWTLTAQAAGTTYLMALFGHEDYVADTIETYRSAVSGREKESFAATFVARLNELESRQTHSPDKATP